MFRGVHIDRDNTTKQLETSLFAHMASLVEPPKPTVEKNQIKSVSFEDALKELLEIEKTSQRN